MKPSETQFFEIDLKPLKSGIYVVRPVALTDKSMNLGSGWTTIVKEKAPLKQIASGILPEQIICNKGLQLIFKPSGNSPACVTENSTKKLISIGWILNENNTGQQPTPTPYVSPDYSNFVSTKISHFPKLNETATLTVTSINPYSFDLIQEDDEFISIFISRGFEFVNIPEEKIGFHSGGYYTHESLLSKQNQTQSLSVEIKSFTEHNLEEFTSGDGGIFVYGVGGFPIFPLDEFKIISDDKPQEKRPRIEIADEEFELIIEQRKKISQEFEQCRLILNDCGSPEINYEEHRKLVQDFHTCKITVKEKAISEDINLTDCYISQSQKAKHGYQGNQDQSSYTPEEALEIQTMRIQTGGYACPNFP